MDDEAAVSRVLTDYVSAFGTLDVRAILPYYHEPCLLVGPQGIAALPTRAAMVAAFTPMMEGLRARGYGRSELSMPHVKRLSAPRPWPAASPCATGPTGRSWSGWASATCCTRPTKIVGRSR